jgi:hypothetical protein
VNGEIEFVQIFGERNSGTNYLDRLLRRNVAFEPDRVLGSTSKAKNPYGHIFGFKHWFVDDHLLEQPRADRTLFIAIFRDPLFWLRSMAQRPYQAVNHADLPMDAFLREEWYAEEDGREMTRERDPETGRRFRNILELRSAKIRDFLGLRAKVRYYRCLRYEDILYGGEAFLRELGDHYPGLMNDQLRGTPRKKDRMRLWVKVQRQKAEIRRLVCNRDRAFIRNQLDMRLERKLGYRV